MFYKVQYLDFFCLRLRVTEEALQLPFLQFFTFPFSSVFQYRTGKSLFANISSFATQEACDQDRTH